MNAALFAALGWTTGQPALALAGFLALTSVLSLNFNAERLSRAAVAEPEAEGRGDGASAPRLRLRLRAAGPARGVRSSHGGLR